MTTDDLPTDFAGNGARLRTLTYDEADAAMMAHAMMLAATRAMMHGAPTAQGRLNFYRTQFLAEMPDEARALHDLDMCAVAVAMSDAATWTLTRIPDQYAYGTRGPTHVEVLVGNGRWRTRDPMDDERYGRFRAMLEGLAPSTCAFVETVDEDALR